MASVKVTGLRKLYGSFVALSDINIDVPSGTFFTLLALAQKKLAHLLTKRVPRGTYIMAPPTTSLTNTLIINPMYLPHTSSAGSQL